MLVRWGGQERGSRDGPASVTVPSVFAIDASTGDSVQDVMARGDGLKVRENRVADYRSYLLRVWRSSRTNGQQWSARLEGLQDGQHSQFTDLDALLAHLHVLLAATPDGPAKAGGIILTPPSVDDQRSDR